MSTSKSITRICVLATVLALLLTGLLLNGQALGLQPGGRTLGYEQRLFDSYRVHTLSIVMDDWEGFLETAQNEEYTVCNVVIDGESLKNVAIRAKGNTSLSTVAAMNSDRYSFKLEFDHYDSTKTYHGLDKLCLNNLIQDNTMMKDYLTYQLMDSFGVAAPLCSYVYLTVNGEDWGLYLAVEAVEESFLERNYGSNYGQLYKPDSLSMGGGRGNGKDFDFSDLPQQEDFPEMPGSPDAAAQPPQDGNGFGGGMGSSDVKLQYIDDDPDSYSSIFDSAKTSSSESDQKRLIQSLKTLSSGTDIESAVDIDAVLRYFVVHNYVVNADSYTGSMVHNYYLYEEDGQLSMIPWDYNLAFGTFQGGSANTMVNDDIDAPLSVTGSDRPMIDWIFSDDSYTGQYHQLFQEFLDTLDPQAIIQQAAALIAPYVEQDPTKFCSYAEFEVGVSALQSFCDLRSQSVNQQLRGEAGTVDASALRLSDMGTMNQTMDGGRGTPDFDQPSGSEPPEAPENATGSPQFDHSQPPEGMTFPDSTESVEAPSSPTERPSAPQAPGENTRPNQALAQPIALAISILLLAAGLVFAFRFKR